MLGCAARPGNLGVSTAPVTEGPFAMPPIVRGRQLAPAGKHDPGDGIVILRPASSALGRDRRFHVVRPAGSSCSVLGGIYAPESAIRAV